MTDGASLRIDRADEFLRDKVVRAVREAIASGVLSPGQRLTDRQLTELTGVSRTSVREAVRHLQALKLLEAHPTGGLQVATLSRMAVMHIYEVRIALEPIVAELFVTRATDEEIDRVLKLRDPVPDNPKERMEAARQVDELLTRGARNPLLVDILDPLHARIHALRRVSSSIPGRLEASDAEYRELFAAIRDRDPDRAREASRIHIAAAAVAALSAVALLEPVSLQGDPT